jgi:F-type H+-transporting ATPase subunit gamma
LEFRDEQGRVQEFAREEQGPSPSYIYEPGQNEILDEIVPRFTALQVYHAILESLASEHAARMVAMKNATDSATELAAGLQLEYNKARQQGITNEMLDITGGAEALG